MTVKAISANPQCVYFKILIPVSRNILFMYTKFLFRRDNGPLKDRKLQRSNLIKFFDLEIVMNSISGLNVMIGIDFLNIYHKVFINSYLIFTFCCLKKKLIFLFMCDLMYYHYQFDCIVLGNTIASF